MRVIYLVVHVLIASGLLSLSVVSLLKQGYRNSINRLFTILSLFVAIWIVSNSISNDTVIPNDIALIANYAVFSSSFGVAILLMNFVIQLTGIKKLGKIARFLSWPLWFICIISATPFVVAGIVVQGDIYAVEFGELLWLYGAGLFFAIGTTVYSILYGISHTKDTKRRQIKSIAVGLLFTLPLVLLFSFIIPSLTGIFSVTEFGIAPIIIFVISLYYGVVKYRLFDIRLAAVRTGAYVLSLLSLSSIYYFIAYGASVLFFHGDVSSSVSISPINTVLALMLAFIFQPIKVFFDKTTNKYFYKDNYNSDDFFERLNSSLSLTTDLRNLLIQASNEIKNTLKCDQVFFFVKTFDDHYVSAGTLHHKQLPKTDASQLEILYKKNHEMIVASLLETNDPIRRLMLSHRIEILLPLIQAGKVIGHLCLGEQLNSGYSSRDIKVLNTISDELAIAIHNALTVQEIRDLNTTLQQRISNATKELRSSNAILRQLDKAKDEFVSMASHQLRTPLTSVKGYISMVLEGDAGKITNNQRHLLGEAFTSSERMVHLINDFLNVSRIQTGKFIIDKQPVDLSKIVQQEIDSLQPSALSRNLKFVYKSPKDFPMIDIDESKIRQVIMNFADNALYYSHENTSIIIKLSVEGNSVVFTVKDSGIGVPPDEQAQLFSKFFRATNARKQRPDGTGVGLYLSKKVINAHDGRIIFESTEGKGSTFGFRLPIIK